MDEESRKSTNKEVGNRRGICESRIQKLACDFQNKKTRIIRNYSRNCN